MSENMYLVRYSEMALKSEPVRRRWENALIGQIQRALPGCNIERERGRIWIKGPCDPDLLRRIFGIASFSECRPSALDELVPGTLKYCEDVGLGEVASFALRIHRVGNHTFSSREMTIELADQILAQYPGLRVDLDHPDLTIYLEIRDDRCYLFKDKLEGAGGLPLGVEGAVVALLSGGIDSPVAAWMMMKRGCKVLPLYVDLFGGQAPLDRALAVTSALGRYQPDLVLDVIRDCFLASAQEHLAQRGLGRYICLICKRRMYRLAEAYAGKVGAKGVVTGESLGQVASQTLDNLFVLDQAVSIPVYRPLIGFDKMEVVKIARDIGTYEPSILPAGNCPMVPRKPSTRAKVETVEEIERSLPPTDLD